MVDQASAGAQDAAARLARHLKLLAARMRDE
jgi:hypothetical protein